MIITENMRNYSPLVPPIEKTYSEFTKKEADRYFDWFLSNVDERADYLVKKVSEGINIPIEKLNFTLESLIPIWKWFLSVAEIAKTSDEDLKMIEASLKGMPAPCVNHMIKSFEKKLSLFSEYVLRDIAMYVSKMFISNYPCLKWRVKYTPKRYIYVNQPIIVGFIDDNPDYPKPYFPDLEPIDLVRLAALRLINGRTVSENDLYDSCKEWVGWVPNCT